MHALSSAVEKLLRDVAATIVMPRYQQLESHQISEKTPGEHVTIADQESEERLNEGLAQILPDARMIGEEACAADPSLLDGLSSGLAWIIDPIDGTSNFASGKPPFAIMVALVNDGTAQAGWMLDPMAGRMCHAFAGGGAFIDGERINARASGEALPKAGISTLFMHPEVRSAFLSRAEGKLALADIPRCAGEQYPRIVLGQNDLALFERTLPWDHVPGALFVEEAGGKVARLDGSPYHFWDGRTGLLAAGSAAMWDYSAAILNTAG
jgi:fructose-1,6-bisphosphatase/inositol monophosphatase family enzyme